MLLPLIQHPLILAAAIILLAILNSGLAALVLRAESRQRFFERTALPQGPASQSPAAQLALPFVTAVPVAALSVFLDPLTREILGGGYLVMQLAVLILNLGALLQVWVLSSPGVAEGRVVLSPQYQYRSSAARAVALAVFAEIVAAAFESVAFAAGGVLLLASAVGLYRRAIQASRRAATI